MNMRTPALIGLVGLLWLFAMSAYAQDSAVPLLINYQGKVTTTERQPLLPTGDYTLSFSIYDKPMAAPCSANTESETDCARLVWGPQVFDGKSGMGHGAQVPVVKSFFNVILGPYDIEGIPIIQAFGSSNRFLEVTVEGENPILPRQQIISIPFALASMGDIPIGGVTSFFGKPDDLPTNWKICDGQMVDDTESPLRGKKLPKLGGRFVRGALNYEELGNIGGRNYLTDRHTHHFKTFAQSTDKLHDYEYYESVVTDVDSIGIHSMTVRKSRDPVLAMKKNHKSHSHRLYVHGQTFKNKMIKLENRPPFVNLFYICRIK